MFAEKLLANVVKAEMLANNSDPEELLEKFVPVGMVSRELDACTYLNTTKV